MLESAYEISRFLPLQIEDPYVSQYVFDHIKKLDDSIIHNIETGIFLHTHILYMIFIYFQLLRISQIKEQEFKYCLVGFGKDENNFFKNIKDNTNPFSFSGINEKTVFRFFRLLGFDDGIISNISACVNDRNELLHATGVQFKDLNIKIEKYINNMEIIIQNSKTFINDIYDDFKSKNLEFLEEDYIIGSSDLELRLFMPYYISEYEGEKIVKRIAEDKIIKAIKDNL